MKIVVPFTPLWFRKKRIYRSRAYFETRVQEALDQHLDLQGSGFLSVGITRDGGLRKPEMHLFWQVVDERCRGIAMEIARRMGEGVVEIVNQIEVAERLKVKRT